MAIKFVDYKGNIDNEPLELRKIFELMKEDADGQINVAYFRHRQLVIGGGSDKKSELELYFGSDRNKKITIVIVKFIKQRQGNCTRLIDLLLEYGRKEGYETLEIQSVQSDEMEAFARKNNFEQEVLHPALQSFYGKEHTDNWLKNI
ncbi:hypothetical protein [Priestia megaterium]|uniref:hypothetical protein n=1 Tax=Priestia megaterium TaxID=1404 RepID=UPI001ADFA531|nr:hypothetical protein [Priestia megaterium]